MPMRIILLLAVLLAILYAFFPKALPSLFLGLVNPLWKIENDARLGTASREELQKTVTDLAANAGKNSALLMENETLKASLARMAVSKPLLATILKKPPFSAYDSFILDVGIDNGVKVGQHVFTLGNIPIGEIAEVIGNISRVKLYSSSGEKFEILIGPSNIEAAASGKGGGSFEVSLPRDTKIKIGDEVHIPSLFDSFVAVVDGIASDPSEPFTRILFHQPVNIYEQRWVIIDTHVSN